MSRWSREAWLRPAGADELAESRYLLDRNFWEYVDSQVFGGYRHRARPDSWEALRGDDCLALNSDQERCRQETLGIVPFCAFHFDRVWELIEAFVGAERLRHVNRMAEFTRADVYREAGIDAAMVHDAKRALAKQAERVYFFAVDDAVKIGRSVDPERRVKTLGTTKAPEGINVAVGALLGTIPGGANVETELHRRFRQHRLVGEWFRLAPIRRHLEGLIAERNANEVAA